MTPIGTRHVLAALLECFGRVNRDRGGNFAMLGAASMMVLMIAVGASVDFSLAFGERQKMQLALDAAVLAAVKKTDEASQRRAVENAFLANFPGEPVDFVNNLTVKQNADKSITARMKVTTKTVFMGIAGVNTLSLAVKSTAVAVEGSTSGPCIYVLGSSGQDLLLNGGAGAVSTKCSFDVHSTANPAFIANSGTTLNFTELCVKGTNYIKNGGTINNLKTACAVHPDPYAGTLTEPTLPSTCTTSGAYDGATHTLNPGMHCDVNFNGSPTVTFKPGLHIIKGRMTINSGATVTANGVTFYFPDTNSELRANGGLTFTGTAPTSGTYKGILMFEKTSNAANNANKTQYIFNGSNGEILEGVIYLPNRNVTYNSKTNVTAKISMVVNQMIINPSDWKVEPYTGTATGSGAGARLTE